MQKKVLILCPYLDEKGGVAYYHSLLKKNFFSSKMCLDFYYIGKSGGKDRYMDRFIKTAVDLFSLIKKFPRYELVFFNPSLDPKAVIRDGLYHFVAKRIYHRKTLVLFHGWDPEFAHAISTYGKRLFRFFFSFDKALVLAGQFRKDLISWGVAPETVGLETTIYKQHESRTGKDIFKMIFLSRFAQDKGCLEAIQTVEILKKEYPFVKLYMAGDGILVSELKDYVKNHNLRDNVEFTGWLDDEEKFDLLAQCGIMLFPTTHGEGMPICIIEGMGAGLAIITRPVAGIPEIVDDGANGFLVESVDPNDFSSKVKYLFENKDIWESISVTNRRIAEEKFEIKNVVKRLEGYFCEILS